MKNFVSSKSMLSSPVEIYSCFTGKMLVSSRRLLHPEDEGTI